MTTNKEIIHIIAPFQTDNDISLAAINRYEQIKNLATVKLWCQDKPHASFKDYAINIIEPYKGSFPQAGKLIVVGSNTNIGHWYQRSQFESVTLVHMRIEQESFYRKMHLLTHAGRGKVSIEYHSERIRQIIGLPESNNN
jgi:hypothetical protein